MKRDHASEPQRLPNRQRIYIKKRLEQLGFETYRQYLASDYWKGITARYRASNKPQKCAVCYAPNVDLHHKTYKTLGRESLNDLAPLCRPHHEELHDRGLDLRWGIKILIKEERGRIKARPQAGRAGRRPRFSPPEPGCRPATDP